MERCDVLIIGAGIAGASAAYELAHSGRVIVLERESQPGYHTTGRSAAVYTQNYGNREIRALTLASGSFFDTPPDGFVEHPILSPRGALFVARKDQLTTLEDSFREGHALVPSIRRVDADEAVEISGSLDRNYVAAAIFEPDARDIDVHALHGGYLKGLRRRGGLVVTDAEVIALLSEDGVWVVKTRAGDYSAPIVVNAAGAWCDTIAELAGVRPIGLVPKRRTVFTFDPSQELDISAWPLTIDVDETFYFKPDAGKILASPADETPSPPCDAQPEEMDVALAIERIHAATTLDVRLITHKWAGLRSFVSDKTPVVGMDNEAKGFFWLAGQGGYGIQTSPAMGRAAAALINTGALPNDLVEAGVNPTMLAPNRLRGANVSNARSIPHSKAAKA